MYSLLQVYSKVHGVSSIFHLKVFLVPVCARGFGYLRCWPRGRGIGLVCTRRFSFHEFYNFLLFNFLILIFFLEDFFFAHDNYPHPQPRHLATLQVSGVQLYHLDTQLHDNTYMQGRTLLTLIRHLYFSGGNRARTRAFWKYSYLFQQG